MATRRYRARWLVGGIVSNALGLLAYAESVAISDRFAGTPDPALGLSGIVGLLYLGLGMVIVGPVVSGAVNWLTHSVVIDGARAGALGWAVVGVLASFGFVIAVLVLGGMLGADGGPAARGGGPSATRLAVLALVHAIWMSGLFALLRRVQRRVTKAT
jgi:hypothetical protein